MKMTMDEFVKRQREFEGYKVRFKARKKDGSINYFERVVNDKFCSPSGNFFEVLEVEILNYIGITTITINQNGIVSKLKKQEGNKFPLKDKKGDNKMVERIWNYLIKYGIANQEELELATDVAGYSVKTLNAVIYSKTGYNDLEQLVEERENE